MIYFLPIEQFEERYTQQWYDWFKDAFSNLGLKYTDINPPSLKKNLEVGDVLDIYNTNYFKMSQFSELMTLFNQRKIKDNDVIFLLDAWGAGLESLEYVRKISGINFKIAGLLHAGTWDENDFVNRYNFKSANFNYIELTWLTILDRIYVATQYHANLINEYFNDDSIKEKIQVVPFPLTLKPTKNTKKENIVVFPHRLDIEKQPFLFDELKSIAQSQQCDITFVKTKEVCKNKNEYYELLDKSKVAVSFAKQETFGIAMLEAANYGCIPLVPNKLSYKEMYPNMFKYKLLEHMDVGLKTRTDIVNLFEKVKFYIKEYDKFAKILPSITIKYFRSPEHILLDLLYFKEGLK
jgi:hypothetical protein